MQETATREDLSANNAKNYKNSITITAAASATVADIYQNPILSNLIRLPNCQ